MNIKEQSQAKKLLKEQFQDKKKLKLIRKVAKLLVCYDKNLSLNEARHLAATDLKGSLTSVFSKFGKDNPV